jgi:hypothetical protein
VRPRPAGRGALPALTRVWRSRPRLCLLRPPASRRHCTCRERQRPRWRLLIFRRRRKRRPRQVPCESVARGPSILNSLFNIHHSADASSRTCKSAFPGAIPAPKARPPRVSPPAVGPPAARRRCTRWERRRPRRRSMIFRRRRGRRRSQQVPCETERAAAGACNEGRRRYMGPSPASRRRRHSRPEICLIRAMR